jgi:hypothetical protein
MWARRLLDNHFNAFKTAVDREVQALRQNLQGPGPCNNTQPLAALQGPFMLSGGQNSSAGQSRLSASAVFANGNGVVDLNNHDQDMVHPFHHALGVDQHGMDWL